MPVRYLGYTSSSIPGTLKPAGLDRSKGLITAGFLKDPTDPRWKDDAEYKEWVAFVAKYLSPAELIDYYAVASFCEAATLIQVLKQCGDDLSRENIMRQAANIKDLELPMLLPETIQPRHQRILQCSGNGQRRQRGGENVGTALITQEAGFEHRPG